MFVVLGLKSSDNGVYFAHVDNPSVSQPLVDFISSVADKTVNGSSYPVPFFQPAFVPQNNGLPPSSLMSFLQYQSFPSTVIGDFKTQFSNQLFLFSSFLFLLLPFFSKKKKKKKK